MTTKYGMTTWNDAGTSRGYQNQKDIFLKLDSGSNNVRIMTKPFQYMVHKDYKPLPEDAGFGFKVPCSCFNGETCPLCEKGSKAGPRWYVGVIDRKTSGYKVLDISALVYTQITGYNDDENWGNPENYDINIKVNKKGGATGYYMVIPCPKKALSEADLVIKAKVQSEYSEDLLNLCKPPTREQLEKRLEGIKKSVEAKNAKNGKPAKKEVVAAEEVPEESVSSEEENYSFDKAGE
jgi:antitoxin component of MazEF toxin-antitoxin module